MLRRIDTDQKNKKMTKFVNKKQEILMKEKLTKKKLITEAKAFYIAESK